MPSFRPLTSRSTLTRAETHEIARMDAIARKAEAMNRNLGGAALDQLHADLNTGAVNAYRVAPNMPNAHPEVTPSASLMLTMRYSCCPRLVNAGRNKSTRRYHLQTNAYPYTRDDGARAAQTVASELIVVERDLNALRNAILEGANWLEIATEQGRGIPYWRAYVDGLERVYYQLTSPLYH